MEYEPHDWVQSSLVRKIKEQSKVKFSSEKFKGKLKFLSNKLSNKLSNRQNAQRY